MNSNTLTNKQLMILEFIKEQLLSKGYPPSVRETCEAVGLKSTSTVHSHLNKLEKYGINVTIRREMVRDINGACGQLRRSYMEQDENTEDTPESGGEGERR